MNELIFFLALCLGITLFLFAVVPALTHLAELIHSAYEEWALEVPACSPVIREADHQWGPWGEPFHCGPDVLQERQCQACGWREVCSFFPGT